jgi:hypothetical protein
MLLLYGQWRFSEKRYGYVARNPCSIYSINRAASIIVFYIAIISFGDKVGLDSHHAGIN